MGWLMLRRSRSLAGSHGRRFPRRGGGPSRVPARAVLLLLVMVAALAPRAFAQTTPNPGDRWTPGGTWTHDVTTTSLEGQLMLQQSVTITGGSRIWGNAAIDACPWTKVTPPLPSTSCQLLKNYDAPGFSSYQDLTLTNFVPTQAMIDNGGVVIRLRWKNYPSSAGGNVAMTEWVPLLPPPNAALVLTPASISENAGVSTVTATLNRTTSAATTITVSVAAGAGAVAADFSLSSATTLTIAADATTSTGTVTITANDNMAVSGSKQVTVSATAAGGNGVPAPSSATLTITDDEAPQTTLLLSSSSIAENAGVATVTATLDRTSSAATTITVSAAAGAGAVAADFSLSSATTLTIAANATTSTGTVTITANDNDTDSPDKQVTVTATVANSQGAGSVTGATLTLTDDEAAPTVALALSSTSISENGGASMVTATLTHPSSAATTVTVTAVSGFYTVDSDATIVIAAGLTAAASDTVAIAAVNNARDEPDRTVTVTATATNDQGTTGSVTGATLTLEDDDAAPGVTLAVSPSSISENGGVSTVTATLDRMSSAATTITVSAAAGAGAIATDFRLSSATTLTIAANATTSTGTVTIAAVDNDVDAEDKTVTVSGMAANSQGAGTVTGASLTIRDDEKGLAFARAEDPDFDRSRVLEVTEGNPDGVGYTVALTSEPTGDVAVAVAAADNAFLSVSPTSLTFTATDWSTARTVTVTATDDGNDDAESSSVSHTASGGGYGGVSGSLQVLVTGETAVRTDGASGTRTYFIEGRRVEVTVEAGVPEGIVVDFAGVEAVEATTITMTISPNVPEATVERAADDGFNLGPDDPEEPRMVVDIEVVNAPGVRVCLPVNAAVVAGARDTGRLRLLRYDGSVWAPVAGYEYDAAMARICASGVTSFSPFAVGYVDTRPEFAGDFAETAMVFTVDEAIDPAVLLPKATGGDGTLRYTLTPALPPGVELRDHLLFGTPEEAFPETRYTWTVTDIDGDEDKLEFSVAADEKGLAFARAEDPDFDRSRVLEVTEGNPTGYTVALTSEPTGTVMVTVTSDNADVTVNPASLTFDATNWDTAQPVTAAADGDDYADAASLTHDATGGGYDGVAASLLVSVKGETAVRTDGASGTRTYFIEGRRVEVTVEAGVPEGIVVDFAGVEAVEAATTITMKISPNVPEATVERAADDGFNLGPDDPEEPRMVVDIEVVNAPGVRVCLPVSLPVNAAVVAGALGTDRLRLLRYDGSVWAPVAGYEYDAAMARICASGVTSFSPFAVGYVDTRPEFAGDFAGTAMVFTVDVAIDPVILPPATGGDKPITYALTPAVPPGLTFDSVKRTISGTPTEVFPERGYVWTATDIDGDENEKELKFTIEVKWNLEKARARARLKRINESILPELSRAMWGSVVDAVTGRLEGSGGGMADTAAAALKAQERTQDEEGLSWRKALEGRTFAVALGAGGVGSGGSGDLVVWGGGSRQSLSLDKAALDWSGDLFSAHMGFDGPLGENLRGGLAVSRFEGSIEYTDRKAAVAGVHESRMTAAHPYAGWSGPGGSRLWGALGYGAGEIEIVDVEVVKRFGVQQADSAFLAAALGGSVPVLSADGLTLALKASGEATRYSVDDNGDAIAKVSVGTHRLRLSAEGRRAYALPDGGTLAPSLELGVRWDGGDGETGAGVEAGGGLEWSLPGLTVAARGRTLAAHEGALKEWGAGGSIRLEPADGRGLSLRLEPRWGATESGLGRLWDEGVPGRPANGGGEARLETELGYGLPALGGAGVTTPYAGFGLTQGGERDIRAGVRLGLGAGFDLGIEAERNAADTGHGIGLDLRIRW